MIARGLFDTGLALAFERALTECIIGSRIVRTTEVLPMVLTRTPVTEPVVSIEPAQRAWNYPLFDAIFQRRARRFPLGAEMPGDLAPFTSTEEPVPLAELEEAMLVMACTGTSGVNRADLPFNDQTGSNWCGNPELQ